MALGAGSITPGPRGWQEGIVTRQGSKITSQMHLREPARAGEAGRSFTPHLSRRGWKQAVRQHLVPGIEARRGGPMYRNMLPMCMRGRGGKCGRGSVEVDKALE